MATSDTRSGFRLPWSSDRTHDDDPSEAPVEAVDATAATAAPDEGSSGAAASELPASDLRQDAGDPVTDTSASFAPTPEEPVAMVDTAPATAPAPAAPARRPSKLIADLAAAMRATAEAAREQALSQLGADAREVTETIRTRSTEGVAALRQHADDDIAAIREWSKAEIARIKEETDQKITGRKATLEAEVEGYSRAVDKRVDDVQRTVAEFEASMAAFFERLLAEEDPARLATLAERMPEPPALEPWTDLDHLEIVPIEDQAPEAVAETPETTVETAAEAEIEMPEAAVDATPWSQGNVEPAPVGADATFGATYELPPTPEAMLPAEEQAVEPAAVDAVEPAEPQTASAVIEPPADNHHEATGWGATDDWGHWDEPVVSTPTEVSDAWSARADVWDADPAPAADAEADPRPSLVTELQGEAGDSVGSADTGSTYDADEAAAFAEAEAEAARYQVDAPDAEAGSDPAAETVESTDLDQSLVDRLASLIPGAGSGPEVAMEQTQLSVTGLISVASIASFKRHLSRLTGVHKVAVSSGPDGEFVFNVTHLPDVPVRDLVPTLPGFAARVTGLQDGIVTVEARDPEAEG
jgi:hypothetical protein